MITRHPLINFAGFLTLLFVAFRLAGGIDWSWLWILCPTFIAFVLTVLVTVATMDDWSA